MLYCHLWSDRLCNILLHDLMNAMTCICQSNVLWEWVVLTEASEYRGADKSLARPDWKNNWKVAIFRPTRSLLPRRPGWTDKLLIFFLSGLQIYSLDAVACFLPGRAKDLWAPCYTSITFLLRKSQGTRLPPNPSPVDLHYFALNFVPSGGERLPVLHWQCCMEPVRSAQCTVHSTYC
jgi:hypothetical protein